jgi:outer membrane protein assembly factor BamB
MRLYPLLLAALLLGGCAQFDAVKDLASSVQGLISGTDNAEPPAELTEMANPKVKLTVLWDTSIGKGYDDKVVNLVPAVTASAVYAAARRGEVRALNRQNGEKLWEVDTDLLLSSGPVVAGDKLLLGTSNAELIALRAADGALLWKAVLSSEVLALPQTQGNTVVIRTMDGRVSALDARTGGTRWSYERSVPPLSVRSLGSPAIAGDLVLDGFGGGKLLALGLSDGKPAWEATAAIPHGRSEIERLVEMDADPLVKGDTVYVSGFQAGVAAVNLKDGEVLWRQQTVSTSHAMASDRKSLFLSDTSSDVWQLDLRTGADLWKQNELHQRRLTVPALIGNKLVVGDFEGYVHVLSAEDGSLLGRLQVEDEPILAPPVVYQDVIYVYTAGGTLAALDLE